jgi:hypothetical protein
MALQLAAGDTAVSEEDTIDYQDRWKRDPMTHDERPTLVGVDGHRPDRECCHLAHLVEKANGVIAEMTAWGGHHDNVDRSRHLSLT